MSGFNTRYGELEGVFNSETYVDGTLKGCELNKKNRIQTPYGEFIPMYTENDGVNERQKKHRNSLEFYKNGAIKSMALEEATPVATSLGVFLAELVTFYEDGKLKRLFPLNGQLTGYWTEDDEEALAQSYPFEFKFGKFDVKVIGFYFYQSGALKSMTLWPDQKIILETPAGKLDVHVGFSLNEDGSLKSVEPAKPTLVSTEIGLIKTYNPESIGLHADENSLVFGRDGKIKELVTMTNGILVQDDHGVTRRLEPLKVDSYVELTEKATKPMRIVFEEKRIGIEQETMEYFDKSTTDFRVYEPEKIIIRACTDCSSCSGCH